MPDLGSLLLLALPLLLLVLMFSTQRKRQREFQATQDTLAPGAEIVTTSGLYATVVALDTDVAVLEIAPGQQVRWDRRAILKVVEPAPVVTDDPATPSAPSES